MKEKNKSKERVPCADSRIAQISEFVISAETQNLSAVPGCRLTNHISSHKISIGNRRSGYRLRTDKEKGEIPVMKKRALSFLLIVCMVFSMLPVGASAAGESGVWHGL